MSDAITLQSIFNAAWDHFIVKGNRNAAVSAGTCRYITEKGARCAVGLVLSEEQLGELVRHEETADTVSMLIGKHWSWFDETEARNGVLASYAYLRQLTSGFLVLVKPEQDLHRCNMAFVDALKYMQLYLHDKHTVYDPDGDKFVLAPTGAISLREYYETVAKMLNLTIPLIEPS